MSDLAKAAKGGTAINSAFTGYNGIMTGVNSVLGTVPTLGSAGATADFATGPGNLFGAAARGLGLTSDSGLTNPLTGMGTGLSAGGTALAALGPIASLVGGGVNLYDGISSIQEDGLGWGNGLKTAGGAAGIVGGAGGLAGLGLLGSGGLATGLAAAGPYGAAAAAGIGLGIRGNTFMEEHLGFGVGDVVDGGNSAGRGLVGGVASLFGGDSEEWANGTIGSLAGGIGSVAGGIVGGAGAVLAGGAGVVEDIGGWVSSWWD